MTSRQSFGPMDPEAFAQAVAAPYGEATKMIRRFDPMWGRAPGEKFKWIVTAEREIIEEGTAIVEASSEEEAIELAADLPSSEWSVDYLYNPPSFDPTSAVPKA